jgi:hypothetical protein
MQELIKFEQAFTLLDGYPITYKISQIAASAGTGILIGCALGGID